MHIPFRPEAPTLPGLRVHEYPNCPPEYTSFGNNRGFAWYSKRVALRLLFVIALAGFALRFASEATLIKRSFSRSRPFCRKGFHLGDLREKLFLNERASRAVCKIRSPPYLSLSCKGRRLALGAQRSLPTD